MTQERLNGLVMIALENDVLETINYEVIIGDFILRNTRCFSVELVVRNTFPILEFMFDIFLHIDKR